MPLLMGSASSPAWGRQLVCRSGGAISAASRGIRQPHGCRWVRTKPAAAFLGGFDGADNSSSSSGSAVPRTQRGFHHMSYQHLWVAQMLSAGPVHAHVERCRVKVADSALLVPQGRQRGLGPRVIVLQCAAARVCVFTCLRLLSMRCLIARRTVLALFLGSGRAPAG